MWVYYFCILLMASVALNDADTLFDDNVDQQVLEGRHLIIGTISITPYVNIEYVGGNISRVDGFVHQIVAWLAEKNNFTYEYREPADGAYGAFINGTWVGLVGMVVRGEINMVATALSVTYSRSLVVDFTVPFSHDPMALLIPYPQLDSTISGIVKPFQYDVWVGIVLSLIIASAVLWFVTRIESRNFTPSPLRETKLFPHFWFLFRVVVNPENDNGNFSFSIRLVVAVWCLAAVVLVNSYTSSLVSYLMAPRFVPLINTVQDLADSHVLRIAVTKFSSVDSTIFAATSGPLVKLGASLRAHPENLLTNLDNIEDKVYYNNLAHPHEETTLKMMIHNDFKITRKCRLFIAKEPLFPDQHAFAITKSDSMTKIFNYEIIWLQQLGLLNHWRASSLPPPNRCSAPLSSTRPRANERLTINYLSSAFLLYGVGVTTSVVAFVLEHFLFMWIKDELG